MHWKALVTFVAEDYLHVGELWSTDAEYHLSPSFYTKRPKFDPKCICTRKAAHLLLSLELSSMKYHQLCNSSTLAQLGRPYMQLQAGDLLVFPPGALGANKV